MADDRTIERARRQCREAQAVIQTTGSTPATDQAYINAVDALLDAQEQRTMKPSGRRIGGVLTQIGVPIE